MDQQTGKYIILIGGGVVLVGIIIYFFGDKLHWLGRLPGDIRVERGNTRFYFPVVTIVVLSLALSLVVNLIQKFL